MTPRTVARQPSLSSTSFWSRRKLMSVESVMPSNHLILCRLLLLPPPIFPCIRVFSNESALCISWPKYYSFSFIISPSNEYSGLTGFISLLSKGLSRVLPTPQLERIIYSVLSLLYGAILTPTHDYWKNHGFDYPDLCQQSDVCFLIHMSKFVIAFLPRNKCLLTLWL